MEKFTKRILVCLIAVMMVLCSSICFASGVIGLPEGTKMKGLELQADGTYKYWQKGLEDYVYNEWKKIDGKQYYFDEHGIMATGAKEIDGEYYLFNADGSLQKEITEVEWAQHMVRATGTLETNPAGESYHQADNYYQDILDEHHEYVAESIDESIQVKLDEEDRLNLIQDERYDLMELNTIVKFSNYKPNTAQFTEIDRVIAKFKEDYIKPGMSDFEKEMTIIQYIVANVEYDLENYYKGAPELYSDPKFIEDYIKRTGRQNSDCFTAYGALVKGKSVCAGYAYAFNMLCSACGLESSIVSGPTLPNGKGAHAWNMIKLDGEWYLVDTTWEDPVPHGNEYMVPPIWEQKIPHNNYTWGRLNNSWINRTIYDFPNHFYAEYDEFEINDDGDTEWRFVNVHPLDVPCKSTKYGPKVVEYYLRTGIVDLNPPANNQTFNVTTETSAAIAQTQAYIPETTQAFVPPVAPTQNSKKKAHSDDEEEEEEEIYEEDEE